MEQHRNDKLSSISPLLATVVEHQGARLWHSSTGEPLGLIIGDDSEYQVRRAEWREKVKDWTVLDRQRSLIHQQMIAWGLSEQPYDWDVSANIYGWACGSHLRSNLNGGRFALTSRGATLEEAIEYGLSKVVHGKNNTLRLSFKLMTDEVAKELMALAGIERPLNSQEEFLAWMGV